MWSTEFDCGESVYVCRSDETLFSNLCERAPESCFQWQQRNINVGRTCDGYRTCNRLGRISYTGHMCLIEIQGVFGVMVHPERATSLEQRTRPSSNTILYLEPVNLIIFAVFRYFIFFLCVLLFFLVVFLSWPLRQCHKLLLCGLLLGALCTCELVSYHLLYL